MVDRRSLEEFRAANSELSGRVRAAVDGFTRSLDLGKPDVARDALLEFVPAMTSQYGQVSAALAAGWYEQLRADSGASGRFKASLAKPVPAEAVAASTRYLAGHLWSDSPESIVGPLLTSVDKYVKQPGRDTIAANARREGVRWARVPTGAKTCAFCLMLASRDAIYATKRSAGDTKGTGFGDDFHGDCDCAVVRIAKASDYPEDYLPDNYLNMYNESVDAAQGDDAQAFLASLDPDAKHKQLKAAAFAMRRLYPDVIRDGVHTH